MVDGTAPEFPSVATQGLAPDPLLDVLRRGGTAFRIRAPYGGECWMVTAHDDVRFVQADPRFSRGAMIGRDVARTSPFPLAGSRSSAWTRPTTRGSDGW